MRKIVLLAFVFFLMAAGLTWAGETVQSQDLVQRDDQETNITSDELADSQIRILENELDVPVILFQFPAPDVGHVLPVQEDPA